MGGIIYFLSLEEPSQPLTSVLWGLREIQRTIAASPVSHEVWDKLEADSAQGQGGWEETVFTGKWQKKGILGGAAPALGFVFIFMYLFSKLWTKKGLWGSPFQELRWDTDTASLLYRLPSMAPPSSGHGLFLSPKAYQLVLKLETLGRDIQKLFSLESVPSTFYTSPMCSARLMLSLVLPLMLLGCRE